MKNFNPITALSIFYHKHMPKNVYLVKNPERYPTAEKAIKEISEFFLAMDDNAKIEKKPDELTGSCLCLEITVDSIEVCKINEFCSLISKADNFDIFPLRNGKISFAITFNDAWIPAPPHKKENK